MASRQCGLERLTAADQTLDKQWSETAYFVVNIETAMAEAGRSHGSVALGTQRNNLGRHSKHNLAVSG
jgi:hypothetical protein